ncbi:hypothetical protein [Xenorhabdus szentirmaii]|uniref:hypothetical protein n=1 Tax=Xenorhabdus szentirmaii TaxID=290112 RepID=UPI001983ADAA|nr:hypothetical protein [Xenorhabdus sp. 38]MBD2782973.1 hypothetical protein [Xenorhabdus sp. 38]
MPNKIRFGSKTGIGTTAGIGGFLSVLVQVFILKEYIELTLMAVPIITPFLSIFLINLSFVMLDDPVSVAKKAAYRRDLKNLKKTIKDKHCSEAAKDQVRKDYDETRLLLSRVGKETNSTLATSANTENDASA